MNKHTPGPWSLNFNQNAGYAVEAAQKKQHGGTKAICTCRPANRAVEAVCEAKANARLIAAAPELLAALVQMVANSAADGKEYRDCHKAAVDAIAKAQVSQ